MDVTFTIQEGEQVFVDQVFVSGLDHTKPYVASANSRLSPGDPLSQIDMLQSQQRLYDLGIFSQVDTAVQNPNGDEAQKNVLVDVQEAKRYTFLTVSDWSFKPASRRPLAPTRRWDKPESARGFRSTSPGLTFAAATIPSPSRPMSAACSSVG